LWPLQVQPLTQSIHKSFNLHHHHLIIR
jgi:hypothetical protein